MNQITKKPDLNSLYVQYKGVEICKICGESQRDHLDNCIALFFSQLDVVLHYYHWAGDYQDWMRREIDCGLEDKPSLLKEINSAFDNREIPKNMLKTSGLSKKNYYISVECSSRVDIDKSYIENLDVTEKNKQFVKNKKEQIEKEAMKKLNESVAELQKIKHMLKDGAYEESMIKIRKEYETKMNEIFNIK